MLLSRLMLSLIAVGALVTLPQAQAMCIYNNSSLKIPVTFDCGLFCGNRWSIEPGDYRCHTNMDGTLYGGNLSFAIDVEAHGYAVIDNVGTSRQQVCVYRADDSLDQCHSFSYSPL